MSEYSAVRQYIVFNAPEFLGEDRAREPLKPEMIEDALRRALREANIPLSPDDYTVGPVPNVLFYPGDVPIDNAPGFAPQSVAPISSPNRDAAYRFRRAMIDLTDGNSGLLSVGVDPALGGSDYGAPTASQGALFGTIDHARHLIRADELPPTLDGHNVNVVLIDSGFDSNIIPAGQFGGGWSVDPADAMLPPPPLPGMTTGPTALHGAMMVETILAFAPKAILFDVPLIPPPKIYNLSAFLVAAQAAFKKMLDDIEGLQNGPGVHNSWILVNAWGIYDRRSEEPFLGDYTENLGRFGVRPHPFIDLIERAASYNIDMVFAAGNCGGYCPDGRCGPNDYGPGRSIWGAAAHQDVLTTGAVRIDETWAGYSSEGPGPMPYLSYNKPDLCTPTQFAGRSGLYPPGSGTSGSAAVAAGVVAALRTIRSQTAVPPAALKGILNANARQPGAGPWNRSFGNGIMDAFAAFQDL